jgi:hypothetical protein
MQRTEQPNNKKLLCPLISLISTNYQQPETNNHFSATDAHRCRYGTGTACLLAGRRHDTLSRATSNGGGRPAAVFVLQASLITKSSLNLHDGLDLRTGGPLQFGCQSEGISWSLCADAFSYDPSADTRHGSAGKTSRHCERSAAIFHCFQSVSKIAISLLIPSF